MTALGIILIVAGLLVLIVRPRFNYRWGGKWRTYVTAPIVIILGILILLGVFE